MTGPRAGGRTAWFAGDDLFELERAVDAFARRLGGDEPLEPWRPTGDEASLDRIAARVGTAPMFGAGTLVVVTEPAALARSAADRDAAVALIGAVPAPNALAFLESLDGSGRRPTSTKPLREAVAAADGEVRDIRAPKAGELTAWIERLARERGMRLGREAARTLAERVGGFVGEGDVDRRRQGQLAAAELEKLALYRRDGEIGPDDVRALVPEAIPGSAWALLDAIADRRASAAQGLLDRLLGATPEQVLVTQIHRRLRELLETADRLAAGEAEGSLVRSMHLHPYRASVLARQSRGWTPVELEAALDGLLELDVAMKGADGRMATDAQTRLGFALWVTERVAARR